MKLKTGRAYVSDQRSRINLVYAVISNLDGLSYYFDREGRAYTEDGWDLNKTTRLIKEIEEEED